NSLGYGFGTTTSFQTHPSGKPDQMSPIRASDPIGMEISVPQQSSATAPTPEASQVRRAVGTRIALRIRTKNEIASAKNAKLEG
ncbi:hypothetical protein, partial [Leucobacter sp. NPDC077196]|uniref:hypothetical protein n=1 Tax=Leucobacter sp. NPDC077196 TaxID=3154959 RepID=UPI003434B892